MHEVSIMAETLRMVEDRARQAGATRVHEVRLRIGALSGVVPESLQLAFEALSPGTLAEKARLTFEQVPARFWCPACQREFATASSISECPECKALSGDLRAGRELELASLEVE